jgi:hypothetical protein
VATPLTGKAAISVEEAPEFVQVPVCTHLVGMEKMEFLVASARASHAVPMLVKERSEFTTQVARRGGASFFATYLSPGYREGAGQKS